MTKIAATEKLPKHHHYRYYSKGLKRFYQTKKARAYTGVVLSITTVAFFTFFTIRPTIVTIAGLLREIRDKESIAQKLDNKIQSLNEAQDEYRHLEDKFSLIEEALPSEANLNLFIPQVEAIARSNNVSLESLNFKDTTLKGHSQISQEAEGKAEPGQKLRKIFFGLSVKGDYESLMSFLDSLFQFRRLIAIDTYTFNLASDQGENLLILNLNATAFYGRSD